MILVWGLALVAAVAWPGGSSARSTRPVRGAAESAGPGIALPALWALHPAFLKTRIARGFIVALLGWKMLTFVMLRKPAGVACS